MPSPPLLVQIGLRTLLISPEGRVIGEIHLPRPGPGRPGSGGESLGPGSLLEDLLRGEVAPPLATWAERTLAPFRGQTIYVADPAGHALVEGAGARPQPAPPMLLRNRRESTTFAAPDRPLYLDLARRQLAHALASPAEVIITLSREEDRIERQVRRDDEALAALVNGSLPDGVAARYAEAAKDGSEALKARHDRLIRTLTLETTRLLPNTSALLGARTAARLLAAAGSPDALLRAPASRLQLLGSRRRPSTGAGPRHGVLYRAEGMTRVPDARRGALARTLASLAAPALRADLMTHGSLGSFLAAKREARIRTLSRVPRRTPDAAVRHR